MKNKQVRQRVRIPSRFVAAFALALLSVGCSAPIANATGTIGCNQVQTQNG